MRSGSSTIDGYGPLPIDCPASVPELCTIVREARASDQAIYPIGGQTMIAYGLPPTRPGIITELTDLKEVIDYPARDMTVTVQAGITIAGLAAILAKEKQRLPIDVPLAGRATLGGTLATNQSGPGRHGHGTLRDYLLGISVVNDEGQEIKAGGRVVKNVAGYDLCKLYIGSLGTLGVITQATLKLKPLPEARGFVTFGCGPEAIAPLLDRLHDSQTRPACIDLLNPAAQQRLREQVRRLLPANRWLFAVGFEDNLETTRWQLAQLQNELAGPGVDSSLISEGNTADAIWDDLSEFSASVADNGVTFKANFVPSATAAFCSAVPAAVALQVHAGNGIAIGHLPPDSILDNARMLLQQLTTVATSAHGNLVLVRCPAAWKGSIPVWGRPFEDFWLMQAVKDKLDPRRLFNPGRYVDGI